MTHPTIQLLIIDDEDDLLQVLNDTARAQGFEVTVAQSVDAAVALVEGGLVVGAVLCDVSMPDGGAAHWLRRCTAAYPALIGRTIVMTGWVSPTDSAALSQIPEERWLSKPFTMSEVRQLVVRMLSAAS